MMSAPNGDYPFRLELSGAIAKTIRRLQRQASAEGRGKQFLRAIRRIIHRLRTNPANFGEPLYRLPILRIHIRCAAIRPLSVDFGICEDQPLVLLKAVRLLSGTSSPVSFPAHNSRIVETGLKIRSATNQ
jgi:hypothetical protein